MVDNRQPRLTEQGLADVVDNYQLVVKALALGARAVAIARPYLWGLASFGQEGVETVLDILRAELHEMMETVGTPTLSDINPRSVVLG